MTGYIESIHVPDPIEIIRLFLGDQMCLSLVKKSRL